jgi:origin recognition complex subunit 3
MECEALALWDLPDTSILFRGYLEAGRMINVFDWYQSFAAVLDAQQHKALETGGQENVGDPPDEALHGRRRSDDEDAMEVDGEEAEDEEWGVEVQARFIRGIHELDFMGFLKHTGRKPDHVTRTVFDVNE